MKRPVIIILAMLFLMDWAVYTQSIKPLVVSTLKPATLGKALFGGQFNGNVTEWKPSKNTRKGTTFYHIEKVSTHQDSVFYFNHKAVVCFYSSFEYFNYKPSDFTDSFGKYMISLAIFQKLPNGQWQLENFEKELTFFSDINRMTPIFKLIQIGSKRWAVRLFTEEMHQGIGFGSAELYEISGGATPIHKIFSYATYEGGSSEFDGSNAYLKEHFLGFDPNKEDNHGYYVMKLVFLNDNGRKKKQQTQFLHYNVSKKSYPKSPFEFFFK